MDNRKDDNRPDDEVTSAATDSDNGSERDEQPGLAETSDPDLSNQLDLSASSLSDEDETGPYADTDNDTDSSNSNPGKDWLVDTGLAAAINPQPEAIGQNSDDHNMEPEDITGDEGSTRAEDDDPLWQDDDFEHGDEEDTDEDEDDDDEMDDEAYDDEYDEELVSSEDEDEFEDDSPALENEPPLAPAAERRSAWPMLVGGLALVLLGFGGWDLYQERAALQARVVELERNQSRVKQGVEVDVKALEALEADNAALTLQLDNLYRDYDTAMTELAGLKSDTDQMADQSEDSAGNLGDVATDRATSVTVSGSQETDPVELESLSPASTAPISAEMMAGTPGEWFVNVGAYASEQSAENWSLRLQNSGWDVIVQDVVTSGGTTLKRVRLTGFDSEGIAKSVATELEADYGTGPLWVGQVNE